MRGNLFRTGIRPGWAKPEASVIPVLPSTRSFPLGHLPKDWAHFKGHYVHDGRAIFSYSVGKGSVLDMPGMIEENGLSAITRTLEIDNPDPSILVLAEGGSQQQKDRTLVVANKGMPATFLYRWIEGSQVSLRARIGPAQDPRRQAPHQVGHVGRRPRLSTSGQVGRWQSGKPERFDSWWPVSVGRAHCREEHFLMRKGPSICG